MAIPKSVYRRFKEEAWAEDLLSGRVRLSTFQGLRNPEHPRFDILEGTSVWIAPDVFPSDDDEHRQKVLGELKRLNAIEVNGTTNLTIKSGPSVGSTVDALVICGSRNAKLKGYGRWCVRIQNVPRFADLIHTELARQFGPTVTGAYGWVQYGRKGNDYQSPNPFFAGTEGNEREHEYRFLYHPGRQAPIEPLMLNIPAVAKLCSKA